MSTRIAVLTHKGGLYPEVELALVQSLTRNGFEAFAAGSKDVKDDDTGVLLIVGQGEKIPGASELITGARASGRRVIYWLTEPLPPAGIDDAQVLFVNLMARAYRSMRKEHHSWLLRWAAGIVYRLLFSYLRPRLGLTSQGYPPHELIPLLRFSASGQRWILRWAGLFDEVWVNLAQRGEKLLTKGVRSEFVPFGYHPVFGSKQTVPRDIDVLFLGRVLGRRERILRRLEEELARRGITLQCAAGSYGADRTRLLNRAKISLQIWTVPWETAEFRFLIGMACGALTVSEPSIHTEPFIDGKHFVAAPEERLAEVIERYVRDDSERERIALAGHQFVTTDLRLERIVIPHLKRLLDTPASSDTEF